MKTLKVKPITIRQGDVMLVQVSELPSGCVPIEPENGVRFVLAHGEVTGHAHAVYEFTPDEKEEQELARAAEITAAALERARSRRTVQMWASPDGEWYLEVRQPSTIRHEEHTQAYLPPGLYWAPVQVEASPENMLRIVQD